MASPLSHLTDDDRRLVLTLLSCVVDYPEDHMNEVHFLTYGRGSLYTVATKDGRPRHHPNNLEYPTNIVPLLQHLNLITVIPPNPPRVVGGKLRIPEASAFQFAPLAIEAYKKANLVDDSEVRHRIGEYFLGQYDEHPDELIMFELGAVAAAVGVEPKRVAAQTR